MHCRNEGRCGLEDKASHSQWEMSPEENISGKSYRKGPWYSPCPSFLGSAEPSQPVSFACNLGSALPSVSLESLALQISVSVVVKGAVLSSRDYLVKSGSLSEGHGCGGWRVCVKMLLTAV